MAPPPRKKLPPPETKSSAIVIAKEETTVAARTLLPSTERALVLRNGKHGAMGSGEMVRTRINGNEKMVLLAEDAMEKTNKERRNLWKGAQSMVRAPFNLETAKTIAQCQMDSFIDLINDLHDTDFCYDIFETELNSHKPADTQDDTAHSGDPTWVAEQFGTLIHNGYMLASAWAIVYDSMRLLEELGLTDRMALEQLKTSERLRQIFLLSFDLVKKILAIQQHRLRLIVQNTAHYKDYFKVDSEMYSNDRAETVEFNSTEVRRMYKSFLDSTIIELCLPGSKFTPQALYTCLDAIEEESPRELGRCSQAMWDAVGDLAEVVRLYDLMETALIKEDGTIWDSHVPIKPYEFAKWEEAQGYSIEATLNIAPYLNLVNPTTNLKNKVVLASIWERINNNYKAESGNDADTLWQVQDIRDRKPHWTPFTIPLHVSDDFVDSDVDSKGKQVVRPGQGPSKKKKPLTIKNIAEFDSDQPPGLLDISDSDEDLEVYSTSEFEDENEEGNYDSVDEGYDTDEDEALKLDYNAAMKIIKEIPDFFDKNNSVDNYAEERKSNSFLTLLRGLKGRLFKKESIFKTEGAPPPDKNRTGPVVTVDGGEEGIGEKKKKKKKKPKKKKKKTSLATGAEGGDADAEDGDGDEGDSDEEELVISPPTTTVKEEAVRSPIETNRPQSPVPSQTSVSKKKKKGSSGASLTIATENGAPPASPKTSSVTSPTSFYTNSFMSTTSVAIPPQEVKPSSGHAFFHSSGLAEKKQKVKTHREQQSSSNGSFISRIFSGIRGKSKAKEDLLNKKSQEEKAELAMFKRLKRRAQRIACRLFGFTVDNRKGHLKWDDFVHLMTELGFTLESTSGSRVRFNAPGSDDKSITFHKPHPDPTLEQFRIQYIRSTLVKYYGWDLDAIRRVLDGYVSSGSDDSEID